MDVALHKPGPVPGFEWTRRWSTDVFEPVRVWAASDVKVIQVSEGYSGQVLKLQVRKFVPEVGDKLHRTWNYKGTRKSVAVPPYALIDTEVSRSAYLIYMHESMSQNFCSVLEISDGLIRATYQQALQCCKDPITSLESRELLRNLFRLWASIRFTTKSLFIVGDETLGMPADILDATSSDTGKIPIPPVLGAQLDFTIIYHIQLSLRKQVLSSLESMVLKMNHDTWLVRYLVIFILLHNTALLTAHDASYARKHGINVRLKKAAPPCTWLTSTRETIRSRRKGARISFR